MIRIDIDDREVRQALENLQRRVSDLTPVMHDIGQALVDGMRAAHAQGSGRTGLAGSSEGGAGEKQVRRGRRA